MADSACGDNRMSSSGKIEFVTDNQRLAELCELWKTRDKIALDTEFMRVSTFYPIAGLIQVGDLADQYLLDPLTLTEWDAFVDLLQAESVIKILHSCSEDLVLFHHMFGCVPTPLFDTQRAAGFLGFGFSISYLNLVFQLKGITLEKGETRSDWLQRPLSEQQLRYAALDVAYLADIFVELQQRLQQKDYLRWFEDDCRLLTLVAGQAEDSNSWQNLYQSMGAAWRLNRHQLGALKLLCVWREQKARSRNKPRSWVARDADLITLAEKMPTDKSALTQLKELSRNLYQQDAEEILALIANSSPVTAAEAAQVDGLPLTQPQRQLLKRCQRQVEHLSTATGIAAELLARKRQLVSLLHLNSTRVAGQPLAWPESLEQSWQRPLLTPALESVLGSGRDD